MSELNEYDACGHAVMMLISGIHAHCALIVKLIAQFPAQ